LYDKFGVALAALADIADSARSGVIHRPKPRGTSHCYYAINAVFSEMTPPRSGIGAFPNGPVLGKPPLGFATTLDNLSYKLWIIAQSVAAAAQRSFPPIAQGDTRRADDDYEP
jgi:hypothetical protein